jgi:hypothetical protein
MSQSFYSFCPTESTTHHADNVMPVLIVPDLNFVCMIPYQMTTKALVFLNFYFILCTCWVSGEADCSAVWDLWSDTSWGIRYQGFHNLVRFICEYLFWAQYNWNGLKLRTQQGHILKVMLCWQYFFFHLMCKSVFWPSFSPTFWRTTQWRKWCKSPCFFLLNALWNGAGWCRKHPGKTCGLTPRMLWCSYMGTSMPYQYSWTATYQLVVLVT